MNTYYCQGCGKTSRIAAHSPGCAVAAAFDAQNEQPAIPEGTQGLVRLKPWSYYEPANGVTLHVNDQGSDGIAFVATPARPAYEPYEQYGVVVPPNRARKLALDILVALDGSADTEAGAR